MCKGIFDGVSLGDVGFIDVSYNDTSIIFFLCYLEFSFRVLVYICIFLISSVFIYLGVLSVSCIISFGLEIFSFDFLFEYSN